MLMAKPAADFRLGMTFALASALTFGMSGPFAKALMDAGWSPTAAVIARLAGGAVVLAVFATLVRPQWPREALAHARTVVLYGLIPIAGAQLCYYNAVAHMSVGVALLLEYTAPVMVVGWIWATTRRQPSSGTLAGVALAIAGIMLVLNIFGGETTRVETTGVIWGLTAAVCAVFYFMMSDKVTASAQQDADDAEEGLNAITLATGGLLVGGAAVTALGVVGIMPLTFTTNHVVIAGVTAPWFVPLLVLGVISTAIAYTLGIGGVARLRPSFASLVGLSEVLFAVLWAWLLIGEAMTPLQAIGGTVVLAGLTLARQGDRPIEAAPGERPQLAVTE
jgi:drug/metabolite transporter (DMT)-like permease